MHATPNNPVIGVLGIIRQDGRLLIIQRSRTVRAPLTWCFPGGHIEPGETAAQALVREMKEELDIEVGPDEHLMTQTKHGGRLVLHCWSARIVNGRPSGNPREVADVQWMTPEQIRRQHGILPGTTDILDAIGL